MVAAAESAVYKCYLIAAPPHIKCALDCSLVCLVTASTGSARFRQQWWRSCWQALALTCTSTLFHHQWLQRKGVAAHLAAHSNSSNSSLSLLPNLPSSPHLARHWRLALLWQRQHLLMMKLRQWAVPSAQGQLQHSGQWWPQWTAPHCAPLCPSTWQAVTARCSYVANQCKVAPKWH